MIEDKNGCFMFVYFAQNVFFFFWKFVNFENIIHNIQPRTFRKLLSKPLKTGELNFRCDETADSV